MIRTFTALTVAAGMTLALGCGQTTGERALSGGLIGAGGGAAIGALAGGGQGAAIGAVAGGLTGAAAGALTAPGTAAAIPRQVGQARSRKSLSRAAAR
jgi:hypothetical protein